MPHRKSARMSFAWIFSSTICSNNCERAGAIRTRWLPVGAASCSGRFRQNWIERCVDLPMSLSPVRPNPLSACVLAVGQHQPAHPPRGRAAIDLFDLNRGLLAKDRVNAFHVTTACVADRAGATSRATPPTWLRSSTSNRWPTLSVPCCTRPSTPPPRSSSTRTPNSSPTSANPDSEGPCSSGRTLRSQTRSALRGSMGGGRTPTTPADAHQWQHEPDASESAVLAYAPGTRPECAA